MDNRWVERVKYLRDILDRIKTLEKLQKNANIQDLPLELKELKNDLEKMDPSSKLKIL